MGRCHMAERQELVVRTLLDSVAARDREKFVQQFAEDAVYYVNAWHEPLIGHDAIRSEFDRQAAIYTDFQYEILHVASTDALVFTERIDTMHIGGKEVSLHWASVQEI